MARFSRTRTSRTVVSITVFAIAIGAAFQFHRLHNSSGITPPAPPLQMSVNAPSSTVAVKQTAVAIPQAQINRPAPAIAPLVTQTPGPSRLMTGNSTITISNTLRQQSGQQSPNAVSRTQSVAAPSTPQPTAPAAALVADANSKVAAGDLVAARTLLNSALLSGSLNAGDTESVKKQLAEINQTLIFSPRQFPKDPLGGVYTVRSGDRLVTIGNAHQIPFELLLPLNRMSDGRKLRYGQILKVINGPFDAVVTKSKFTLDLYLGAPGGAGSTYVTTFPVGLGTDNSTPTGTWTIKNKVTHPAYFPPADHPGPALMPDDPKNPLGPYWMGLEGTDGQAVGQQSYGIHGTIDPSSIGKQSSMGCIRLRNEDVEVVYKLLMQGKSTVVVRE